MTRTFTRAVPSYPSLYLTMAGLQAPDTGVKELDWDMDIGIAVWVYAWNIHQLFEDPVHLFDANIYHPQKNTLAMIDNYFGVAMLGLPAMLITKNPAVMYNSIIVLAYLLTAWAVFGYMLYRTRSRMGAMIAGLMAALLPFHYAHLHTIHKTMFLSIPLSLWALEKFLETKQFRYGLGFILVAGYQLTCTWYLTVLLAVFYLFYFIYLTLFRRRILFSRALIPVILAGILILAPLTWFFARPYMEVQKMFPSFNRSVDSQHSVTPMMYLTTGENNLLYGHVLKGPVRFDKPLRTYFPGFVLYGLGLWGMILYIRRKSIRSEDITGTGWFLMVFGLLSMLIALGPYLKMADGSKIPLPFYFLYHSLPVMKALRGPQDFVLIFYFSLMFFGAYAVKSISEWSSSRTRIMVMTGLVAFLVLESVRVPFPVVPLTSGKDVPQCYTWAAEQPDRPVVAAYYPRFRKNGEIHFQYLKHFAMYYSIFHFCPIPDGHSAYVPPRAAEYRKVAQQFPSRCCRGTFEDLGIQFVLLDFRGSDPVLKEAVINTLASEKYLIPVKIFDDSLVYKLNFNGTLSGGMTRYDE